MHEHHALTAILEPGGITSMYQPICSVRNGSAVLAAFECLARGPRGTNFEHANVLFDYVRLKREESLVDRACVNAALAAAPPLTGDLRLTVNVHASTLGRDREFVSFLRGAATRSAVPIDRLTVEIVEHAPPWDGVSFLSALDELRGDGVRIALDDVGLGQSNFKMMLDVRPDYLKIDRWFVTNCDSDANRRAVIDAFGTIGARFGAEIVAEGVESEAVIKTLQSMGVHLMQGYWFAKPLSRDDAAKFVARR